jgi:hypothetical protein
VLGLEDIVTGKVRALSDRQAARDFYDVDGILSSGRWTVEDLSAILAAIRPELPVGAFGALLRAARKQNPRDFAALGMGADAVNVLLDRLDRFAEETK